MGDFAFMIKTLLRPKCLARLLESLRLYFPHAPVWIADDSPTPYQEVAEDCSVLSGMVTVDTTQFDGPAVANERTRPAEAEQQQGHIVYATFPHDIGIGTCYNWMIDRIPQRFICLLDDDFVFTDKTRVDRFVPLLKSGAFDLLGGEVWSVSRSAHQGFVGDFSDPETARLTGSTICLKKIPREKISGPVRVEVTMNFWMASTESLRATRWDPVLKVCRHEDFFLRFVGYRPRSERVPGYRAGFWRVVEVEHAAPPMTPEYRAYRRDRFPEHQLKFENKWGFPFR